jgi:hypothetical protein
MKDQTKDKKNQWKQKTQVMKNWRTEARYLRILINTGIEVKRKAIWSNEKVKYWKSNKIDRIIKILKK